MAIDRNGAKEIVKDYLRRNRQKSEESSQKIRAVYELLGGVVEQLNDTVRYMNASAETITQAASRMGASDKANSEELRKIKTALEKQKEGILLLSRAVGKYVSEVEGYTGKVDAIGQHVEGMEQQMAGVREEMGSFGERIGSVEGVLDTVTEGLSNVMNVAKSMRELYEGTLEAIREDGQAQAGTGGEGQNPGNPGLGDIDGIASEIRKETE